MWYRDRCTVQCTGWDYYGQSSFQVVHSLKYSWSLPHMWYRQWWNSAVLGRMITVNLRHPVAHSRVSAGESYVCIDIRVQQCWGRNNWGEASPPSGTFTQTRRSLSYMWYRQWWNSAVLGQHMEEWLRHPVVHSSKCRQVVAYVRYK